MARKGCPGCRERDRRIAALERRVADLEARLGRNATNSSVPPSANPPAAPKPVVKEPTGRPPGGQPGHAGCRRLRLPADRVQRFIDHVSAACRACGHALPQAAEPRDPAPVWHQVAELPPQPVVVTEHRGQARTCPACGVVTQATIPNEVRARAFGPRLTAAVAYLSGVMHGGKRAVAEVVRTVFGMPIALGSVPRREREVAAALAAPHAGVVQAVRRATAKQADETGWKLRGRSQWLWAAATRRATAFVIHPRRGRDGLTTLLGRRPQGVVGSDRWSAYGRLLVYRRQLCWAHLKRAFTALAQRRGTARQLGQELLLLAEDVFHGWYPVRDGTLRRSTLRAYVDSQRPWLRDLLANGGRCAPARALCRDLLRLEPALWTFTRRRGVEPTTNRVERALRPAVLWRKRSFGSASTSGCRFSERILTAVTTLRQRGHAVLDYLERAVAAHRLGLPAPSLLAAR